MTVSGWDLLVGRDDLALTDLIESPVLDVGSGRVLLRVDRVGVTANNVTYALVGDAMNYWNFFPAREGWGRVPLWGFADVVASDAPGVDVGMRVYGYLPPSSHLVVLPEDADEVGFRDGIEHRKGLPGPYNIYATTSRDPAYEREREDLQILYRPLFITSFMLDDFLADNDFFGAERLLVSSASSKTAYGTAFCVKLREGRPSLVGMTSPRNLEFTKSLGCYDEVVTYDDAGALPTDLPTLYVDVAGSAPLRATIHERLGPALVYDAVVGATHLDALPGSGGDLAGPDPTFFFAPDQIRKRRSDWGPGGIEKRYGASWRLFAPAVEDWVDVQVSEGPEGLRAAWLEVLSGGADPRAGHVIQL